MIVKFCTRCDREVMLIKRFRILPFLLLGLVLYVLIYLAGNPKYCPHCRKKNQIVKRNVPTSQLA